MKCKQPSLPLASISQADFTGRTSYTCKDTLTVGQCWT